MVDGVGMSKKCRTPFDRTETHIRHVFQWLQ